MMSFLELAGVSRSYGGVEALKEIELMIEFGDFLVLVGPSGCGKSTLLSIIAGLERLDHGRVKIAGRDVSQLEPKERDIAMVFQSYALYPSMTVRRNIGFSLEMARVEKATREQKILEVAQLLRIDHVLDRRPSQLSGGQRQRVAMGRALVRNPKIFLFDEPLSNLDAKLRVEMRMEIKKLHRRLNTTVVYVTHDQIEAMTMATKIAVMRDGRIQQFGKPAEIYNRPANTFVATFMGSPPMNLLPVNYCRETKSLLFGKLPLPVPPAFRSALTGDMALLMGIRAEHVAATHPAGEECWSAMGEVIVIEPTGPNLIAVMQVDGHEITAMLPGDATIAPGAQQQFSVDLSRAVLFEAESGNLITTAMWDS